MPEDVVAACHNGEDSVTISGPKESVEKVVEELQVTVYVTVILAYNDNTLFPLPYRRKTYLPKTSTPLASPSTPHR